MQFIGERKGTLSVLLAPAVVRHWKRTTFGQYRDSVKDISQSLRNPWSGEIDSTAGARHSIIHDAREHVATYLENVHILWPLGVTPAATKELHDDTSHSVSIV